MAALKPMLAPSKPITHEQAIASGIKWLVQPKYDGIRVTFWDGHPYTRSGKEIPNVQIREGLISQFRDYFSRSIALDGELLCYDKQSNMLSFNQIQSIVMRGESDGRIEWRFLVFDYAFPGVRCDKRLAIVRSFSMPHRFTAVPYCEYGDHPEDWNDRFEGLILRNPASTYKHGRCTTKENILHKMVAWERDEATVVDTRELIWAGGIEAGQLGALVVEHPQFGQFNIGSGFTEAERKELWTKPLRGRTVTFKFKRFGMKTAPRSPIFVGFREKE